MATELQKSLDFLRLKDEDVGELLIRNKKLLSLPKPTWTLSPHEEERVNNFIRSAPLPRILENSEMATEPVGRPIPASTTSTGGTTAFIPPLPIYIPPTVYAPAPPTGTASSSAASSSAASSSSASSSAASSSAASSSAASSASASVVSVASAASAASAASSASSSSDHIAGLPPLPGAAPIDPFEDVRPGPIGVNPPAPMAPLLLEDVRPGPTGVDPPAPMAPPLLQDVRPGPTGVDAIGPKLEFSELFGMVLPAAAPMAPLLLEDVRPGPTGVEPIKPASPVFEDVRPGPTGVEPVKPASPVFEDVRPGPTGVKPIKPDPPVFEDVRTKPTGIDPAEPVEPEPPVLEFGDLFGISIEPVEPAQPELVGEIITDVSIASIPPPIPAPFRDVKTEVSGVEAMNPELVGEIITDVSIAPVPAPIPAPFRDVRPGPTGVETRVPELVEEKISDVYIAPVAAPVPPPLRDVRPGPIGMDPVEPDLQFDDLFGISIAPVPPPRLVEEVISDVSIAPVAAPVPPPFRDVRPGPIGVDPIRPRLVGEVITDVSIAPVAAPVPPPFRDVRPGPAGVDPVGPRLEFGDLFGISIASSEPPVERMSDVSLTGDRAADDEKKDVDDSKDPGIVPLTLAERKLLKNRFKQMETSPPDDFSTETELRMQEIKDKLYPPELRMQFGSRLISPEAFFLGHLVDAEKKSWNRHAMAKFKKVLTRLHNLENPEFAARFMYLLMEFYDDIPSSVSEDLKSLFPGELMEYNEEQFVEYFSRLRRTSAPGRPPSPPDSLETPEDREQFRRDALEYEKTIQERERKKEERIREAEEKKKLKRARIEQAKRKAARDKAARDKAARDKAASDKAAAAPSKAVERRGDRAAEDSSRRIEDAFVAAIKEMESARPMSKDADSISYSEARKARMTGRTPISSAERIRRHLKFTEDFIEELKGKGERVPYTILKEGQDDKISLGRGRRAHRVRYPDGASIPAPLFYYGVMEVFEKEGSTVEAAETLGNIFLEISDARIDGEVANHKSLAKMYMMMVQEINDGQITPEMAELLQRYVIERAYPAALRRPSDMDFHELSDLIKRDLERQDRERRRASEDPSRKKRKKKKKKGPR